MTLDEYQDKVANDPRIVASHPLAPKFNVKADDLSRFQNHAPITGATYQGNRGAGSLKFNGTSDFVELGTPVHLNNIPHLSFGCWINPIVGATMRIVARWAVPSNEGYFLRVNSGGTLKLVFHFDTTLGVYDTTSALVNARWAHVAFSAENRLDSSLIAVRLYINGDASTVVTTVPAGASADESAVPMYLGRQSGGLYFNGEMADVQVYGAALRPDEIRGIYADSINFYGAS